MCPQLGEARLDIQKTDVAAGARAARNKRTRSSLGLIADWLVEATLGDLPLASVLVDDAVQHYLQVLLLCFLEVLHKLSRRRELSEDDSCFSDRHIPVVLQLEDLLPEGHRNELRVASEYSQHRAVRLLASEVVAQTADAPENIEASCLALALLAAQQSE